MKCPYCDSEIQNRTGTCPHCGASVTYDEPMTYEEPESFPSDSYTTYSEEKPKKKHSKVSLVFTMLILLIPLCIGIFQIVKTASIKHSSTLTEATLVDSRSAYTEVDRKTRKSGKTRKTYYELELYQHLVVQYTIDGEEFTKDIGTHKVFDTESRSSFTQSERDSYLLSHTYKIGDTFNVYVTDKGSVYLASTVNSQSRSSIVMVAVMGGVIALFVVSSKKKKR